MIKLYFTESWYNDIALVKLEEPVPTSELPEINHVQLPEQGETSFPADNQDCVMKGWGCTQGGMYNRNV